MKLAQKVVVALWILANLGLIALGVTLIWMVLVAKPGPEIAIAAGLCVLVFIAMRMLRRAYIAPSVQAIRAKRLGIVPDKT
jgi:hypothetical protein